MSILRGQFVSNCRFRDEGTHLNSQQTSQPQLIVSKYKPPDMYETHKTHNTRIPLRPAMSQFLPPIIGACETLRTMITLFLPARLQLKSRDDFHKSQ